MILTKSLLSINFSITQAYIILKKKKKTIVCVLLIIKLISIV